MVRKSVLVVLLIFLGLFIEYKNLDGLRGEMWGLILPTDTRYSVEYSEKRFRSITIGMNEQQVVQILGEPIARFKPYYYSGDSTVVAWQYSESPSSTNYRLRQLYLKDGVVVKKVAYFYLD